MPDIYISVQDKIAQVIGKPVIVCGNNDYTVHFTFDSEWDEFTLKTVRIKYLVNGVERFDETTCAGNICELPAVYNCESVMIGVKAGTIHTSTGALIPCEECITDGTASYDPPSPDIYNMLLERIIAIENRLGGLSFRRMTAEEYAALSVKDPDTIYFVDKDDEIDMYAGDIPVSGGGGAARYSAEGVTMRHLMGAAAAGSGITTVNE